MTRPTNMAQPLPALTTGFLGREAPNPITDPVDPVDRAAGLDVFVPPSDSDIAFVQKKEAQATTISLDVAPTAGNLLVLSWAVRSSGATAPTTPDGWTAHPDGYIYDATNNAQLAIYYKFSDGTETTVTVGAGGRITGLSEWSGLTGATVIGNETTGTTNPITGASVSPDAGSAALIIGYVMTMLGDSEVHTVTPIDMDWTELHDHQLLGPTRDPHHWAAYQIVASASGAYAPTGTYTHDTGDYSGQTIAFSKSTTPTSGGPNATDGDPATYVGPYTDFYLRLDQARRIRRAELRLAWENSGSRTVTIYGANAADFSDEIELASDTETATGSWTAQDETLSWSDLGDFEYVHLVVSVTARLHGWELYEASLDTVGVTDHPDLTGRDTTDSHPADAVSYDGYESGLDATDVQAAIDEHIAEHPSGSSALDDLTDVDTTGVADGDVIAFDSADSTWKPVAPGTPTLDYGEDGDISTLDYDDTPAAGASDEVARADHVHGMPSEAAGGSGGQISGAWDIEDATYTDAGLSSEMEGSLDASWAIVGSGTPASGTASLLTIPATNSLYDLTTLDQGMILQPIAGGNLLLRADSVIGNGEQLIVSMSIGPGINNQANGLWGGLGVNDGNDTDWRTGTHRTLLWDGINDTRVILLSGSSTINSTGPHHPAAMRSYWRIARASDTFHFFFSQDGTAWAHMGSVATTGYVNTYILAETNAAASPTVANTVVVNWIRHVANTNLYPW